MASLQGWGRQTWNSGAWNTFAPVDATGNGLTSTVGTVSLVTTNVFGVTGIGLTTSIGDATQASEYAATGNAVTTSLGTMPNPTIVDNQLLTGWNRGVGTSLPLGWNAALGHWRFCFISRQWIIWSFINFFSWRRITNW